MELTMNASQLLSELSPDSLRLFTARRMVRLDEKTNPEIEQTYLTINGTPDAYRWLAALLTQMANSADEHECGTSVIFSPRDLSQISMTEWSSLDLGCCQKVATRNVSSETE
jgi:hypothetical protein